jgi:ribosomal protein S18 acetylase RimI-like enzyme
MAMVSLRAIGEADYQAFFREALDGYAEDLAANAGFSREAAYTKAESDFAVLLPDGLATEGHTLAYIVDNETGRVVGRVWLFEAVAADDRHVVVYDITVNPNERGRGVGRAAMLAVEDHARRHGCNQIRLNVFGGNEHARRLYRGLGYQEVAVEMSKTIPPAG